ncbi:MATE family efflux transporter [Bacillus sp. FJAT-27445]|uniref:MATE family efflux transporter n=1 Tax=Bacillus sp. FJAT-27445 TaxID=1679166 RepID=UPI0007441EF3|nr:MATE family efflux transporter [Bacillus sp. FJAT-27445]
MEELEERKTSKKKLRVILALALPAMIENILQTVVGFVDTLFVAKIGLTEITAVGVANAILAVYIAIFMAIGVGTSSLISRSIGAGEMGRAKSIARQATIISIVAGILFAMITLLFSDPLLRMMGATEEVLTDGRHYMQIVGLSSVFIALMVTYGSILRAAGDTKTPMKVGFWINVVHIALDYVLIFGLIGLPGFGVVGAALATVIVRILGTFALYYYIKKSSVSFMLSGGGSKEDTASILSLSTPAAIERLIMRLGQVLYFGLIVKIGSDTYAAHTIAGNIEMFSYMPGYGLAVAATTLVGQHIGAKRFGDAYQYGILTTGVAVVFMSLIGVLFYFLAPWFATWFTTDQNAIDMVVTALRIDAFAQPALAVGLVLAGALQGAGDTKSPMYSTAIGMWGIRVIGVYLLGIQFGMGIAGIWISIVIDLYVRGAFLFYKFRKTVGKSYLTKSSIIP